MTIEIWGWARPFDEVEATLLLVCFGLRALQKVVNIFEI